MLCGLRLKAKLSQHFLCLGSSVLLPETGYSLLVFILQLECGNEYAHLFLHLFSRTPFFKNAPLNVPVLNSMPLEQLKHEIQGNAGNCKCFRNPLCQHSYLQGCVLTVRAGAGEGSTLGSNNPKLVVNLNPLLQNQLWFLAVRKIALSKG